MKSNKRSQMSLEFLLIITFLFVLLAIVVGVIGYFLVDMNVRNIENERDDFANMILNELELVESSSEGYSRTFIITSSLVERYNPNINTTYLTLNDTSTGGDELYYYIYPGNERYNISIVEDGGIKFVTVSKEFQDNENYIDLS